MIKQLPQKSDLAQLRSEVLERPAIFALPCNLSDHWLDMIARDLNEAMAYDCDIDGAAGTHAAAPLALILHILKSRTQGPAVTMSLEELWDYFQFLHIEINLEIVSRRTSHKVESATLKTIFTNRNVHVTSPGNAGRLDDESSETD
ncbi:hypothetical protein [Rhodoferax sp.]|uniref:hypothetical protein n=1 Tax=Rhodoferax sp. TaxID=50421 RepID=UPI00283EB942|nr:hypothetical protein [Rhodoferax sp.]MDR3371955.1 hypothetical protein [Rhodoferax sp.]